MCYTKINPNPKHYKCKDWKLESQYQNICDGSVNHCETEGKARCSPDPNCFAITYPGKDSNDWLNNHRGVAICPNTEITFTPDGWNILMKCEPGPGIKKRIILIDKGCVYIVLDTLLIFIFSKVGF